MVGGLLDDPELIAGAAQRRRPRSGAARSSGARGDDVEAALQADIAAARSPLPAARALDHKLGGPREERRYTAPSYELARSDTGAVAVVPGFNPVEAYEAAIANLAPELERRPKPASVAEILAWAREPLATAEVALIAQLDAGEGAHGAEPHRPRAARGRRLLLDARLSGLGRAGAQRPVDRARLDVRRRSAAGRCRSRPANPLPKRAK